jgi:hypothetical protein
MGKKRVFEGRNLVGKQVIVMKNRMCCGPGASSRRSCEGQRVAKERPERLFRTQ